MSKTISLLVTAFLVFSGWGCVRKKPKSVLDIKPDASELLMKDGISYMNYGKYDLAEQKLLEALEKNPNLQVAMDFLGQVYMYKGELPKAVEMFKKLLQLNPQYYDAYNSLGVINMQMNNYDSAKENLLIAANAKDYLKAEFSYANLAILEMRSNHIDAALRYIEKGLIINNRYGPLHSLKAVCLESQGKFQEALDCHEKGLTLVSSPSPQQLLAAGRLCLKMGKKRQALDYLEQAFSKCQDDRLKEEIMKLMKETEK